MGYKSESPGFTLIELLVVVAIMSLLALIAAPKIANLIGNERRDSGLLAAYITAVSDDAFIYRKTNYLCISLARQSETRYILFENRDYIPNSVSVYSLEDSKFIENNHKIIEPRTFSNNVSIKSVHLEGAPAIEQGDVVIPFYSDGTSESFTIEVFYSGIPKYFKKDKNSKIVRIINEMEF